MDTSADKSLFLRGEYERQKEGFARSRAELEVARQEALKARLDAAAAESARWSAANEAATARRELSQAQTRAALLWDLASKAGAAAGAIAESRDRELTVARRALRLTQRAEAKARAEARDLRVANARKSGTRHSSLFMADFVFCANLTCCRAERGVGEPARLRVPDL